MRTFHLAALAALVLVATACGGGSGAGAGGATLVGKVTSLDGRTADLGGIEVAALSAGAVAPMGSGFGDAIEVSTGDDGSFTLHVRSHVRIRIRFTDPANAGTATGEDGTETGDDPTDGTDIDGGEVEVGPFEDGEVCTIEVEIGNGMVIECWVGGEGPGAPWAGDGRLLPPDCESECAVRGEIEVRYGPECGRIAAWAIGLDASAVYEVLLVDPAGNTESLGLLETDEQGLGKMVYEACLADGLPFGAEGFEALAGAEVLVVDDQGNEVLRGVLPGGGPQHDDGDFCHGATRLLPPEDAPEPDAKGEAAVRCEEGCCRLVVEAFGFQEARTLTVELGGAIDPAVTLGEFTLDERGIGRFAMEDCLDEILSQVATSDDGTVSGKADPGTGNDGDPGSEPPFPGFPPDLPPDFDPILVRVVDAEGTLYLEGPLPAPRNGRCGGIVPPDLPPLPEPTGGFSPLFPPDGTGGYMLRGMAFLDCSGECCTLGISAGWFDDPGTLTAVVYDAEGNAETLGTLEVTEGFGDLVYDSCSDLPFGVSSLDELAGYRLAIEDADGDPVLKGEFPGIFQWGGGDGTDPGPGVPWGGMPWGGMPWGGMGGGLR